MAERVFGYIIVSLMILSGVVLFVFWVLRVKQQTEDTFGPDSPLFRSRGGDGKKR